MNPTSEITIAKAEELLDRLKALPQEFVKVEDLDTLFYLIEATKQEPHIGQQITLYRIYTDSKGPHLTSAVYEVERDPEHICGIRFSIRPKDQTWHRKFKGCREKKEGWPAILYSQSWTWDSCSITPSGAWDYYIQRTESDARESTRTAEYDKLRLKQALNRKSLQKKRDADVSA